MTANTTPTPTTSVGDCLDYLDQLHRTIRHTFCTGALTFPQDHNLDAWFGHMTEAEHTIRAAYHELSRTSPNTYQDDDDGNDTTIIIDTVAIERACDGHHVDLTPAERREAARRLLAKGNSIAATARLLGLNRSTVEKWKSRGLLNPTQPDT